MNINYFIFQRVKTNIPKTPYHDNFGQCLHCIATFFVQNPPLQTRSTLCQKQPLTVRPQPILEAEQESDVHAFSICTAGGLKGKTEYTDLWTCWCQHNVFQQHINLASGSDQKQSERQWRLCSLKTESENKHLTLCKATYKPTPNMYAGINPVLHRKTSVFGATSHSQGWPCTGWFLLDLQKAIWLHNLLVKQWAVL